MQRFAHLNISILLLVALFSSFSQASLSEKSTKIFAISTGSLSVVLMACLGASVYKLHLNNQTIKNQSQVIDGDKAAKKDDQAEIDRLNRWYDYQGSLLASAKRDNQRLDEIIKEVGGRHKNDTRKAQQKVNGRFGIKGNSIK